MPGSIGRRSFLGQAAVGAGLGQLSPAASAAAPSTDGDNMPSSSFDDLSRAVSSVLKSKRLGQPVFVRLTVQGKQTDQAIVDLVAGLCDLALSWLDQEIARLHAVGNLETAQLTATLSGSSGGSAVISFTGDKSFGDGIDLLLIGNHGAIFRDAGSGNLWDSYPTGGPKPRPATRRDLQKAFSTGKPVSRT